MRLTLASVVLASLLAIACGGSSSPHSCQDVVNAATSCASKLGGTANVTLADCTSAVCTNKQAAIDCVVGAACTNITQYNTAVNSCLTSNGCQ